jgi:hypothetical protein
MAGDQGSARPQKLKTSYRISPNDTRRLLTTPFLVKLKVCFIRFDRTSVAMRSHVTRGGHGQFAARCKMIAEKASAQSIRLERTAWSWPSPASCGLAYACLQPTDSLTRLQSHPTTWCPSSNSWHLKKQVVSFTLTCIREAAFAIVLQLALRFAVIRVRPFEARLGGRVLLSFSSQMRFAVHEFSVIKLNHPLPPDASAQRL